MIASSKQLPYQKNDQNPISSLVAQIVPTLANRSRNEGVLGRALTGSSKKGREKNPSSVQPKNTVEEHIIEQEDERTQSSASKQLLKQNRELETELKKYKEREEKSLELATRLAAATTEKAKIEEQLSQYQEEIRKLKGERSEGNGANKQSYDSLHKQFETRDDELAKERQNFLDRLEETNKEKQDWIEKFQTQQKEYEKLKGDSLKQLGELNESVNRFEDELKKKEHELTDVKNKLTQQRAKQEAQELYFAELSEKTKGNYENACAIYMRHTRELTEKNEQQAAKIKTLTTSENDLKENIKIAESKLSAKFEELTQQSLQFVQLQTNIEKIKVEKTLLDQQLDSKKQELNTMLTEKGNEIAFLKQRISEFQKIKEDFTNRLRETEDKLTQIEREKRNLECNLEQAKLEKDEAIAYRQKTIESLQETCDKLEMQFKELQRKYDEAIEVSDEKVAKLGETLTEARVNAVKKDFENQLNEMENGKKEAIKLVIASMKKDSETALKYGTKEIAELKKKNEAFASKFWLINAGWGLLFAASWVVYWLKANRYVKFI